MRRGEPSPALDVARRRAHRRGSRPASSARRADPTSAPSRPDRGRAGIAASAGRRRSGAHPRRPPRRPSPGRAANSGTGAPALDEGVDRVALDLARQRLVGGPARVARAASSIPALAETSTSREDPLGHRQRGVQRERARPSSSRRGRSARRAVALDASAATPSGVSGSASARFERERREAPLGQRGDHAIPVAGRAGEAVEQDDGRRHRRQCDGAAGRARERRRLRFAWQRDRRIIADTALDTTT